MTADGGRIVLDEHLRGLVVFDEPRRLTAHELRTGLADLARRW